MVAEVARGALGAWVGLRTRWRGLALPIFASPLLPSALLFAIGDDDRAALGSVPDRGRGPPRMEVLTLPIRKTSTCLTLPSLPLT